MKRLSEMTLEELWQLFPIILIDYSSEWVKWYADVLIDINKLLPSDIRRIRHVGSTSVPHLIAKPTVDILLEINDNADQSAVRKTLESHGWMTMAVTQSPYFKLDMCNGYTPMGFAERVFHLHVRPFGDWDEPRFCEYLRNHPETAQKYAALKRRLAVQFKHNRDAYTNAKTDFVIQTSQLARKSNATIADEQSLFKLLDLLERHHFEYWLDGGWGVDVLIGHQNREHRDIDINFNDLQTDDIIDVLHDFGYVTVTDQLPCRMELHHDSMGFVDIHPFHFFSDGSAKQADLHGGFFNIPDTSFATASFQGRNIPCISPAGQKLFHSGYSLRPQDIIDLALLQSAFGD